jgi:predicted outer membrane repeat protein
MAIGAGISVFGTPSAPVQLDLNDSLIEGNQNQLGNFGGGLGLWSDTATKITNCTFKDNYSYGGGGAISTHSGDLTVAQSLFTNNKSDGDGGAIFINHGANRDATLTNVTFDSNNGRAGGGVYIGAMSMTVLNSTFAGNNATSAWYGGALAGMPTGVTIENSLFSNNKSNGVLAHCQASGPWAVSSRGSNLSDAPASDCNFTLASDLTSRSVSLAPLDDYGGPTKTFALLPWSPAIGHGNAATCAAVDQRSFDRRSNGTCDIGAYEFQ